VLIAEHLIGKGYDVKIYDANVSLARIFGGNKEYIEREIPHIDRLMCGSIAEVLEHAEVLVIGNRSEEFRQALPQLRPGQRVLDLVRIVQQAPAQGEYHGLCW
jgi:GDP-mannose 6-dehydrogenase